MFRLTRARNTASRAASIRRISSEVPPNWYRYAPHWWHQPRPWGLFAIIVWWWLPGTAERQELKMMNVELQRIVSLLQAQNSALAGGEKRKGI